MVIYKTEAKIPWIRLIIFLVTITALAIILSTVWPTQKIGVWEFAGFLIVVSLSSIISIFFNNSIELDKNLLKSKNWNGVTKQINFDSLENLSCSWTFTPGTNPRGLGSVGLVSKSYSLFLNFNYQRADGSWGTFSTFMIPGPSLGEIIEKIKQIYPNITLDDSIQKVLNNEFDPKYKAR